MELENLTPHAVTLVGPDGQTVEIPPSGTVARCVVTRVTVGTVRVGTIEVPVSVTSMGEVTDLPPARPGVAYVVSRVVAEAATDREDLLVPDDAVRDDAGRIVGCRALARVRPSK
jgi:hypothetical protein